VFGIRKQKLSKVYSKIQTCELAKGHVKLKCTSLASKHLSKHTPKLSFVGRKSINYGYSSRFMLTLYKAWLHLI